MKPQPGNESSSSRLMDALIWEAQSAERQQDVEQLMGLKKICDDIESGQALKLVRKKRGIGQQLSGKINTNTVDLVRRTLNIDAPSRSKVNRHPPFMRYIELREEERLLAAPNVARRQSKADVIIAKIDSFEDRRTLIDLLHIGAEAERELKLLKSYLTQNFCIDLSREDLNAPRLLPIRQTPSQEVLTEAMLEQLRILFVRLTTQDELSHFGLEFDGERVKEKYSLKPLVSRDELSALRSLLEM